MIYSAFKFIEAHYMLAPMSLVTCSHLGDGSLRKQNKKDRPSQREKGLLLLRSRVQRNTEMERTTLIISSSPPKAIKLLNLSNSFLEAKEFLPCFSTPQDLLQFLAQKACSVRCCKWSSISHSLRKRSASWPKVCASQTL